MVRTCRCPRQQGDQTISQLVGGGGEGGVSYTWSTKHIVALPGMGMSLAISLFVCRGQKLCTYPPLVLLQCKTKNCSRLSLCEVRLQPIACSATFSHGHMVCERCIVIVLHGGINSSFGITLRKAVGYYPYTYLLTNYLHNQVQEVSRGMYFNEIHKC